MKPYKWKFMNDEMLDEMDALLKSEHGATLTIWSAECANAGVKGVLNGLAKGALIGFAVGTVVGVGKIIKDKVERKRLEKAIEDFCESTEKDVDI